MPHWISALEMDARGRLTFHGFLLRAVVRALPAWAIFSAILLAFTAGGSRPLLVGTSASPWGVEWGVFSLAALAFFVGFSLVEALLRHTQALWTVPLAGVLYSVGLWAALFVVSLLIHGDFRSELIFRAKGFAVFWARVDVFAAIEACCFMGVGLTIGVALPMSRDLPQTFGLAFAAGLALFAALLAPERRVLDWPIGPVILILFLSIPLLPLLMGIGSLPCRWLFPRPPPLKLHRKRKREEEEEQQALVAIELEDPAAEANGEPGEGDPDYARPAPGASVASDESGELEIPPEVTLPGSEMFESRGPEEPEGGSEPHRDASEVAGGAAVPGEGREDEQS